MSVAGGTPESDRMGRRVIVPGHEIEVVDEVVERRPDFYVVVKRAGEPREMARESDPRTS